MLTWGQVAGRAYPGVLTSKQVLVEKRVLFFRFTIVLALIVGYIDGQICGFAAEASMPVASPLVIQFGPVAARNELAKRIGI